MHYTYAFRNELAVYCVSSCGNYSWQRKWQWWVNPQRLEYYEPHIGQLLCGQTVDVTKVREMRTDLVYQSVVYPAI